MVIKGDVTNDGKITPEDWLLIRLNLLGLVSFDENEFASADTNSDNTISLDDMANVKLHLLGKYIIDEVIY